MPKTKARPADGAKDVQSSLTPGDSLTSGADSRKRMSDRTLRALVAYVAGTLDRRQRQSVRRYLARSPEAREVVRRLSCELRKARQKKRPGVRIVLAMALCLSTFAAGAAWHCSRGGSDCQVGTVLSRLGGTEPAFVVPSKSGDASSPDTMSTKKADAGEKSLDRAGEAPSEKEPTAVKAKHVQEKPVEKAPAIERKETIKKKPAEKKSLSEKDAAKAEHAETKKVNAKKDTEKEQAEKKEVNADKDPVKEKQAETKKGDSEKDVVTEKPAETKKEMPGGSVALSSESQAIYRQRVLPFLKKYCYQCHDDKDTEAGFRIDDLGSDFLAGKTADHWKEIYDKLGLDKMPPRRQPRPPARAVARVMDWINSELREAEKRAKTSSGRIPMRRLNRTEYVNTLRDLFFLDEAFVRNLEAELPMDGKVDGFDRGGASLFIDEAQMTKYLETAELVLSREVFGPPPQHVKAKYFPRDARLPKDGCVDVVTWPFGATDRDPKSVHRRVPIGARNFLFKNGGVEFLERSGAGEDPIGFLSMGLPWPWRWYGHGDPFSTSNFQDGWYRIKVRAGAFKGTGELAVEDVKLLFQYAQKTPLEVQEAIIIDAPIDKPRDFETKVYLRAGSSELNRSYRLTWNGLSEVAIGPAVLRDIARELYAKNYGKLVADAYATKKQAEIDRAVKTREDYYQRYHKVCLELKAAREFNPKYDLKAIPRLWLESFEIEGPLVTWPPKGRKQLFFAGENRSIDESYLREMFARFLPRAYRRPVEPKEIDDVVHWVLKTKKESRLSGSEAVREGVKAVLCSPGFLLIQEPTFAASKPRRLTDYELASRLSYFLWSSMPDAELFELAAAGKLHEPTTLEAQVRRMLADSKSRALVDNFTGQWLKVREFSTVVTDRIRYKAYDDLLRDSSRREPFEFFHEVLRKDLSILNFVDSDFLVIDERLAQHYGIDGVKGSAFRRVAIRAEHHRGGVLGMAGVLTFLTDGLRTLPVRRAAFVLETLWNAPPPPPPPNAANLPPIKGKNLTVRQRLEQHRQGICASCHARIDPFGMALENYDAIGAWRERQNGEGFRGDSKSPPLDVSGILPSGRAFNSLGEYKQALLADKSRFVHGFVEKMLTYALGRPVGATDRETVEAIIAAIEKPKAPSQEKYGLQSLVQAVIASQAFQMK